MKLNLKIDTEPHMVKINAQLEIGKVLELEQLLKEFKDVFAWTYKDLKAILLKLAQHKIELDITIPLELPQHKIELETTIPPAHQAKYRFNPKYVTIVKHDIDKLLVTRFIQSIEEATWLSPIVVLPNKNGKLKICINFGKLNVATKKDPYQHGK
jgi:hypothetical protein